MPTKAQLLKKAAQALEAAFAVPQGEKLLADVLTEKKIIRSPSIIIPSKIGNVKEAARRRGGEYGARRVERAADEIPNLEKLYKEEALHHAFVGDNARAVMTMNPKDFENYAVPLQPRLRFTISGKRLDYPEYMSEYLPNVGAFNEVPFLHIDKEEQGLPLIPFISGHEGRHRNRVMVGKGEEAGLVQLLPSSELREPFPRRNQDEYIDALREELKMTDDMVLPERFIDEFSDKTIRRPAVKLPEVYAKGGSIEANAGRGMAGLTRSKQNVNPKDVQAMFLELAASQGMPFAEAGAEYLRGNLEDAKSSAAIDAVLSALPVAGVAAKPVARAVKRAAPVTKELLHDAFNAAQEAGLIQGPAYAIKAYHGSPHKFDKFDISKIGSGEGAQAYGHGLYFAESPKVAIGYQKRLSDATSPHTYKWEGSVYEGGVKGDPVAHALGLVYHQNKSTAQRIAKMGIEDAKRGEDYALDMGGVPYYEKMLETAKKVNRKDIKASQGNLYEVDLRWPDAAREAIDPLSPHHFLDYDKPLSEQSEFVQDALQSSKSKQLRAIVDYASSPYSTPGLENEVKTMGEAIKLLGMNASPAKGSSLLAKQGIPGIRYLDAGSRSSGGTSNYVLFSDELAEILKRNDEQLKASKVMAPRDEALRIAQENAVKMLGLPPGNTPMDRARAMGYEGGLYHGGTNDVPAFTVNERKNVYATDEPRIGDIYATATGRHSSLREINAGPNVMPLMYRGKLAEVSDQGATGGGWYNDNLSALTGLEGGRKIIKEVPKKGFSGVKITDMDDLGGRQTQYVFPDPSVLRSRFAAFDPARRDENDLLAGLAALGIGLPALSLSTDKDYD